LELERLLLANQISVLEMKVASAPTQEAFNKMKHELRILKQLEYNAIDFDHLDHDPEMTHSDYVGKDDDLESVLVAKLRKVEADLVRERREKGEGIKERDELNQKLSIVQKSLSDAESLVASLENDLQRAVATPTKPARSLPNDVPFGSTYPPNPNTLQRILDPSAAPVSNVPVPSVCATAEKVHDDHSVATIVMAQRDRLRARCDALETERDVFKRELQVQVEAAESLKTDNTKLYEKVRYLQSFTGGGHSKGGSSGYLRGSSGRGSERDLDLEALEQRYEASVDPFQQFSRAERQRKFK
jgi:homeobox protein cut-like